MRHDSTGRPDIAYRLLAATVRAMRPSRREWGRAMLAELDQIRLPRERVRFAYGAVRVALFPPRAEGSWWPGLVIRTLVAGAAIHAVAPVGGYVPAVLMAVPVGGAWAVLTRPGLAIRRGGAMSAQVAVVAGLMACVVLTLRTVQHYPQVITTAPDHGWSIGLVFDVVSAGYLAMVWLLPRLFPATARNGGYALGAGLVMAVPAALYVGHPSLDDLWLGTWPGVYLLACLAVPTAAALATSHRGHLDDGLETALWTALIASLITSIMIIAATYRVASAAGGSLRIAADARQHGVANASVWLASDNLGGAIILLVWMPVVFVALALGGTLIGRAVCAFGVGRSSSPE